MPTKQVKYNGEIITVQYSGEFDPAETKRKLDKHFGNVATVEEINPTVSETIPGEKPTSLPPDEDSQRGNVRFMYGLTDEEQGSIENAFKEGYESGKESNPDLTERYLKNFRQSFFSNTTAGQSLKRKEIGQGLANDIAMSQKRIQDWQLELDRRAAGGFSQRPEFTDEMIRDQMELESVRIQDLQPKFRAQLLDGLQKQARRAGEYAGMPEWDGIIEGASALAGQLTGSAATPETFLPGGRGNTLLRTLAKQGATGAATNASLNPFVQSGNVASGDQSGFETGQLALDATLGAIAPVVLKSPKTLVNFVRKRGANDVQSQLLREAIEWRKMEGEPEPVQKAAGKVRTLAEKGLTPVSSRLERISPGLGKLLRRHAFEAGILQAQAHKTVEPFLKQYKRLPAPIKRQLDRAFKNQDADTIAKLTDAYHLSDSYKQVRSMLDDFHSKASESGYEVGYLKDYMPRNVKDHEGLINYLKQQKDWGIIEKAIDKEAKRLGFDVPEAMDITTRAEIVTKVLRNFQGQSTSGADGNLKQRTIKEITAGMDRFYHDTPTALLRYVDNVSRLLADRQIMGQSDVPLDISLDPHIVNGNWRNEQIGLFVAQLIEENQLDAGQQKQLQEIVSAYFDTGKSHELTKGYKSLIHITSLGSPISAITQFGDLAPAFYKNGLWNGVMGLKDAALSRKRITREDIGIENIASDFADYGKLAKLTDVIFKTTGFAKIDRLGKETFINGLFRQFQKRARAPKGSKRYNKLLQDLRPALGDDAEAAIEAFARGDKADANVRFALMDSLSEFQPLTRAEMPEAYLRNPNGRIFYALKTFTIRQFDALRREAYDEMKKGNVAKGIRNLVTLGGYWIAMGAAADQAKDWILGRETSLSDRVVENALKTMGVTRWSIYQARERGLAEAVIRTVIPPVQFWNDLQKDAQNLTQAEFELKHAESLKSIPWVGKIFYWRYGKGAEKEKRNRERRSF